MKDLELKEGKDKLDLIIKKSFKIWINIKIYYTKINFKKIIFKLIKNLIIVKFFIYNLYFIIYIIIFKMTL